MASGGGGGEWREEGRRRWSAGDHGGEEVEADAGGARRAGAGSLVVNTWKQLLLADNLVLIPQ